MFGKIKLGSNKSVNQQKLFTPKIFNKQIKHNQQPFISKKQKIKQKQIIKNDLKGSQFRILNEMLYTTDSKEALNYFNDNKEYYETYHDGFRKQCQNWQINPVVRIIQILKSFKSLQKKKIIDLGCGDGKIQEQLNQLCPKIKSYDLVSSKQFIRAVDIANLPLKSNTQHIAIFSLSLMGINYIQFLVEATRVLKLNGKLIIAQVESRANNWSDFENIIIYLGYVLQKKQVYKYFRIMIFNKNEQKEISKDICDQNFGSKKVSLRQYSKQVLHACIYKKR